MNIVGIDSMTVIYAGLVPRKSTVSPELSTRAKLLLNMLVREKAMIVLPTICVGEILVPVETDKKGNLIATLSRRFVLHPYDNLAAAIASDLWVAHKKLPKTDQHKNRVVLSSDVKIVACAKAKGATRFYSHDTNCRKVASLCMKAFDLPEDDPKDMFAKVDIERGEYDSNQK